VDSVDNKELKETKTNMVPISCLYLNFFELGKADCMGLSLSVEKLL